MPKGVVPQEAIDFFDAKGIKPSFDYREVWKEEHSAAFTIAKVTEVGILGYARQVVADALADGTTFREFQQRLKPALDQSGWSNYNGQGSNARLRVIYDTNLRTARAAGQWQRIERTKDELPYLSYELGPSVRHREEHVSWQGTTLPVDHPWWDDHMPPNGYLCKCHVEQMSSRQYTKDLTDRDGIRTSEPPTRTADGTLYRPGATQSWQNPKTGKVESFPVGVQPGFNYNPGKNRMAGPAAAASGSGVPPPPKSITPKPAPGVTPPKPAAPPPKAKAGAPRVNGEVISKPAALKGDLLGQASRFTREELGKALVNLGRVATAARAGVKPIVSAKKAGHDARRVLNDLLAMFKISSTDQLRMAKGRARLDPTQKLGSRTAGIHQWNGEIKLDSEYAKDLISIGDALIRGRPLTDKQKVDTLYAVKVLIHEAIHGSSPRDPKSTSIYSGAGRLLEEAAVEAAASRICEQVFGVWSKHPSVPRGDNRDPTLYTSYQKYQAALMGALGFVGVKGPSAKYDAMATAAIAMRGSNDYNSTIPQVLLHFLSETPTAFGAKIKAARDKAGKEWDDAAAAKLESGAIAKISPSHERGRARAKEKAAKAVMTKAEHEMLKQMWSDLEAMQKVGE